MRRRRSSCAAVRAYHLVPGHEALALTHREHARTVRGRLERQHAMRFAESRPRGPGHRTLRRCSRITSFLHTDDQSAGSTVRVSVHVGCWEFDAHRHAASLRGLTQRTAAATAVGFTTAAATGHAPAIITIPIAAVAAIAVSATARSIPPTSTTSTSAARMHQHLRKLPADPVLHQRTGWLLQAAHLAVCSMQSGDQHTVRLIRC